MVLSNYPDIHRIFILCIYQFGRQAIQYCLGDTVQSDRYTQNIYWVYLLVTPTAHPILSGWYCWPSHWFDPQSIQYCLGGTVGSAGYMQNVFIRSIYWSAWQWLLIQCGAVGVARYYWIVLCKIVQFWYSIYKFICGRYDCIECRAIYITNNISPTSQIAPRKSLRWRWTPFRDVQTIPSLSWPWGCISTSLLPLEWLLCRIGHGKYLRRWF